MLSPSYLQSINTWWISLESQFLLLSSADAFETLWYGQADHGPQRLESVLGIPKFGTVCMQLVPVCLCLGLTPPVIIICLIKADLCSWLCCYLPVCPRASHCSYFLGRHSCLAGSCEDATYSLPTAVMNPMTAPINGSSRLNTGEVQVRTLSLYLVAASTGYCAYLHVSPQLVQIETEKAASWARTWSEESVLLRLWSKVCTSLCIGRTHIMAVSI